MSYFAYLDPGTGSLFIQAMIGVALAATVTFRSVLAKALLKIRTVFVRKSIVSDEEK
jgi:hypothetical protein